MQNSLEILDRVIELTENEIEKVVLEDVEGLLESAKEREVLLQQAWDCIEGCDKSKYSEKLLCIKELQDQLDGKARSEYSTIRELLINRNSLKKGIKGYKPARGRSVMPKMVAKLS